MYLGFPILFILVPPVFSKSTFSPNCTFPPAVVNVVWSPNIRGTFDILWSCIFTLIICTWTVLHLNVPEQYPEREKWRHRWKDSILRGSQKLKWMIMTLFIPELQVAKAYQDLIMARRSTLSEDMKNFACIDGVTWTYSHSLYANMGGFVFRLRSSLLTPTTMARDKGIDPAVDSISNSKTLNALTVEKWNDITAQELDEIHTGKSVSQADAFLSEQERQVSGKGDIKELMTDAFCLHLNTDQILVLRSRGIIKTLPDIMVQAIEDKSKGDPFVKALALVQVLWLVIQLIVRASQGLPITSLEITVLAFCSCTFFTYTLSWSKPQSVNHPTYIDIEGIIPQQQLFEIQLLLKSLGGYTLTRVSSLFLDGPPNRDIYHRIPNDTEYSVKPSYNGKEVPFTNYFVGMGFAGTLFGALHCLAWHCHFPSSTEKILWRVASIYTTLWMPLYVMNYTTYLLLRVKKRGLVFYFFQAMEVALFLGYVICRLVLIVLSFRSIFSLEPEAFTSTPAMNFLHFQ